MHIDPEQFATARGAALTAARDQLPPSSHPATTQRQLTDSTLMMLGHSAESSAPNETPADATAGDDSELPMLGAAEVAEDMPLAASALSGDSEPTADLDSITAISDSSAYFGLTDFASPSSPFWTPSLSTDLGSAPSALAPPSDPLAIAPGESLAPPSLLPTALMSTPNSFDPAPSAVEADWSDLVPAGPTAPSTSSPSDGHGFETADAPSLTDAVTGLGLEDYAGTNLSMSNGARGGIAGSAPNEAGSGNKQSSVVSSLAVSVTLTDQDQLVATAVAKVAATAKAAARSTAESVFDHRSSIQRTQDDACRTARAALFGS